MHILHVHAFPGAHFTANLSISIKMPITMLGAVCLLETGSHTIARIASDHSSPPACLIAGIRHHSQLTSLVSADYYYIIQLPVRLFSLLNSDSIKQSENTWTPFAL